MRKKLLWTLSTKSKPLFHPEKKRLTKSTDFSIKALTEGHTVQRETVLSTKLLRYNIIVLYFGYYNVQCYSSTERALG